MKIGGLELLDFTQIGFHQEINKVLLGLFLYGVRICVQSDEARDQGPSDRPLFGIKLSIVKPCSHTLSSKTPKSQYDLKLKETWADTKILKATTPNF